MTGPDDGAEDGVDDGIERTHPTLSGARLFPIGFGLGAMAALALFFGYRAVEPEEAMPRSTSVAASAAGTISSAAAPAAARPADGVPAVDGASGDDATVRNGVASNAEPDTASYATADADVAAATADAPTTLAGLEELASLGVDPSEREATPGGSSGLTLGTALPSIDDPTTSDLFGGPVVMVSSAVPRVIMLADGTSLVPGERLPGGHRIVDIRRERILLERDGIEWRVRIP